ncbi:hypothetical protein EAO75_43050 [Streptomyces sp. uw30]|uniref:hypothetical protein n=1 Tax=Streptomyces sp. uw30 TaxID=1828179 RepID=UPI0011CD7FB6|nr:hypothetical protein [Streptomyces sp. uw30]TXS41514.1 hypothetical protein EAO75_43050 [Streptomyces sp. uw30]
MTAFDARGDGHHATWWKAPLVATVPGLPILVWEYVFLGAEDALGLLGGAVYWAFGLLALAWALPHRRSLRPARVTAAVAGLVCAVLPLLLVMLMAMVMASG